MGVTAASRPRGWRNRPKQERINFRGARSPGTKEIDEAIADVVRSGVVPILAARLGRRSDAERRLSILGYEVAFTLLSAVKGHRMYLVELVRLVNSFGPHTLRLLKMPEWHYDGCYDRFQRLNSRVATALDIGWTHRDTETGEIIRVDRDWYRRRIARAPVPNQLVRNCALAVDGTAMTTWNRLHNGADPETIEYDGAPRFDEEND